MASRLFLGDYYSPGSQRRAKPGNVIHSNLLPGRLEDVSMLLVSQKRVWLSYPLVILTEIPVAIQDDRAFNLSRQVLLPKKFQLCTAF